MSPVVVVVGGLPRQQELIRRRCRGVSLRFADATKGVPRIPAGDELVVCLPWVSHVWTEAARNQWPRGRVHYAMGGVSAVVKLVKELAADVAV